MRDEALQAIRERTSGIDEMRAVSDWITRAVIDRFALVREVEALRAELDRLRREHAECARSRLASTTTSAVVVVGR